MSKNKKNEVPSWVATGHRKPVTRREFLAHGLIPFAAATFLPNWMQLLSPESALAQTVCPTGGSSMAPFIHFNMAGGAALGANYVPMNQAGSTLSSYNKMGLGNSGVPIEKEFNNVPFAGMNNGALISKILEGIRATASAQAISNTAFLAICVRTRDDSAENEFGMAGLIHKAGAIGAKLPQLGSRNSFSGISAKPAVIVPPSPLIVKSYNDIANSLNYTASISNLNQTQKEKLTKLIGDLNASQSRKLASTTSGSEIQKLIECSGVKNSELVKEGASITDPLSNSAVAGVWGLTTSSAKSSESYILGSMAYNTIMGTAGSASFDKGGYDYHGNARTVTDGRDREAGVVIGRILETARTLNKPVFLLVTSDGSVSSEISDARDSQFNSDRGSAGLMYMIIYNPTGRPVTSGFQIGHFTDGQAADDKFVVGNNPALAAQAVFANYLQFNKRLDLFNTVITRNGLSAADLNQVVKVG